MNALIAFLTNMDARAARAVMVSLLLLVVVGAVFLFGGQFARELAPEALVAWFQHAANQWYALPATILIFIILSFVGAPQFVLMAAAVLAFGPVRGFFFAWIATLCSASVNFWVGRWIGAEAVERYGGPLVKRITGFVSRHGLWASAIVRLVPSGPFIVVNMAFGVAGASFWHFLAGTAVGSAPKILVVGLTGESVAALVTGQGLLVAGALILAVIAWIAVMLAARRRLPRPDDPDKAS